MGDDTNALNIGENEGSLAGDALLQAVRQDMQGMYGLVKSLHAKVEALDAKVEARLRDTTPMWEVVVSRLDTVIAEQENHGRRLDAIEAEQRKQGARLDAIEGEIRHLRRRTEAMMGELSRDVVEVRADQHDLEGRLDKLEKPPA